MSIEFVIIPITGHLETYSYDIKSTITSSIKHKINIEIDQNYSLSLTTRINKWKKNEYDIIIVDHDFIETNSFVVRFSDKGSKPKNMSLEKFIDSVNSFEDEDEDEDEDEHEHEDKTVDEHKPDISNNSSSNHESTCIIM